MSAGGVCADSFSSSEIEEKVGRGGDERFIPGDIELAARAMAGERELDARFIAGEIELAARFIAGESELATRITAWNGATRAGLGCIGVARSFFAASFAAPWPMVSGGRPLCIRRRAVDSSSKSTATGNKSVRARTHV